MNKNLFLGGYDSSNEKVKALINLLKSKGYDVRLDSLDGECLADLAESDRSDEEKVKAAIANCLSWANSVIIICNEDTDDIVEWEIKYASQIGKPILGVCVDGQKDNIKGNIEQYASLGIVDQIESSIIKIIEGEIDTFEQNKQTASSSVTPQRKTC